MENFAIKGLFAKILMLCISVSPALCIGAQASAQQRQIQVVIIGVPTFAISKYNSPDLSDSIIQRCKDIKSFFQRRFPEEQGQSPKVKYHEYYTSERTTKASLSRFLELELPKLANGTLTFLFIISHGEIENHPNALISQDLRIVASDTSESDFGFTSIPISTGLISWMQKIPAGSTIFVFLDTCHAGAADNRVVGLTSELQRQYGVKMMILASSLAQQKAYKGTFTAALLSLWDKNHECLTAEGMIEPLREEIQNNLNIPLADEEGFATFIVEYTGPICFNNFGNEGKLLFIYAGTSYPSASWSIYQEDTSGGRKKLKVSTLDKKSFDLARLNSGLYTVDITKNGQVIPVPDKADLREKATEVIWLDTPPTLINLGAFTRDIADLSEKSGLAVSEVASLRLRSASSFLLGGDLRSAQPLLRLLPSNYSGIPLVEKYSKIEISSPISIEEVKKDLSKSANFLMQTAKVLSDQNGKYDYALEAYLLYGMAGSPKNAKQVREKFHLDFNQDDEELLKAETNLIKTSTASNSRAFQVLSTMKSIDVATNKFNVASIERLNTKKNN